MKHFNDFNRIALAEFLEKQDPKLAFLFALLCAERSRVCYWVFCIREKLQSNYRIFDESLTIGFREFSELRNPSSQSKKLQSRCQKVDSILIDTEEYGDGLAVQAQCASIALRYAFEVLNQPSKSSESASWAAYKNMEVIYTFNESMSDVFELSIDESQLYERELMVQEKLLKELSGMFKKGGASWAQIQQLRHASAEESLPIIMQIK